MRKLILFAVVALCNIKLNAQELQAKVTVSASRVGNNVNRNTFVTLQTALNNFLNNRKWTSDNFLVNEKIECSFFLSLESTDDPNVYNAALTVQAARPVFNSSYLAPMVNFQDENVTFKYVEYQQLDFNENRVSGSDALVSNLTAVFAYYAYMILGFDYDSFSIKAGEPYFQKAQNIINNAPDSRNIAGWKAFDGTRNRYWLTENLLNSRYAVIHDAYYNYYRAMDKFYEDENAARVAILNVLNLLSGFNADNPNTMINQFFFQGKSSELVNVFAKATPQDKIRALELLQKLDLTNATKYKEELQ